MLRLLATGLSNRDIGSVLFIAESTVKTHVEHIIGKLGVSDRVQAAVWAARVGLVQPVELSRSTVAVLLSDSLREPRVPASGLVVLHRATDGSPIPNQQAQFPRSRQPGV